MKFLCDQIEEDLKQLAVLSGTNATKQMDEISTAIAVNLNELRNEIRAALVRRVVLDFVDAGTKLKKFSNAVLKSKDERDFRENQEELLNFTLRVCDTSKVVAIGNNGNRRISDGLVLYSAQVSLTFKSEPIMCILHVRYYRLSHWLPSL